MSLAEKSTAGNANLGGVCVFKFCCLIVQLPKQQYLPPPTPQTKSVSGPTPLPNTSNAEEKEQESDESNDTLNKETEGLSDESSEGSRQ